MLQNYFGDAIWFIFISFKLYGIGSFADVAQHYFPIICLNKCDHSGIKM